MSVRVQVILEEEEAARFKSQALKESKSMSAWLRNAGRTMVEMNKKRWTLADEKSLIAFFNKCNEQEKGEEPDWEEHKRVILESIRGNNTP